MSHKFITHTFGPLHFKTRFLPFIENNNKILHNFIYIAGNYELYEPYKHLLTILDGNQVIQNSRWSNGNEIIYDESDPIKFVTGFKHFCIDEKKPLPLNLVRFNMLECMKNNILNMTYVGTNTWFTNKPEIVDAYFESIPVGTFHAPLFNMNKPVEYYLQHLITHKMQEKFPNIIIPNDFYYFDGFQFGMHFKNKDDLKLFFDMWDYIVYLHYTDIHFKDLLALPPGYTKCEQFVGYVMRIFELNFGYKVENFIEYWDTHTLGKHLNIPHDTWHNCGIRSNWDVLHGLTLDESITTISQFIEKNRQALDHYHSSHGQLLKHEITADNVILRHINL